MNRKAERPHILVNALLLDTSATYRGAGISQYSQALLDAIGRIRPEMDVTVVTGDKQWSPPTSMHVYRPHWPVRHPVARIAWEQGRLPFLLRTSGARLYHGLAFIVPLSTRHIPLVVTVHDLSFVHFPETLPPAKALYLKWLTRTSVRRAHHVIAVSESTRRDVIAWSGIPARKVSTVPNGVSPRFRPLPPDEVRAWREKKGLPARFILYVGTLQPRKNVDTLIRAYARWRGRARTSPPPLILAGAKGWYYEDLFRLTASLGLEEAVHFPGYIPPEELPYWYNAATLFAYPSLFEGFGLPVLEAMACGTPVVAAATSALPEVVGDGGLLLPPKDVDAWAQALASLLSDPARRDELRGRGLQRAKRFSWERTARETVAVYHRLLDGYDGRSTV